MNVDKFGHNIQKQKFAKNNKYYIVDCVLKYTSDGNLNAQNKIIKNLSTPVDDADSASKEYVDTSIHKYYTTVNKLNHLLTEVCVRLTNLEKITDPKKSFKKNEQGKHCK
jgi:hypothetical protein